MLSDTDNALIEKNGFFIHEIFIKIRPDEFMLWGYAVVTPDKEFVVFRDKFLALDHLDKISSVDGNAQGIIESDSEEMILKEDIKSALSTSTFKTS